MMFEICFVYYIPDNYTRRITVFDLIFSMHSESGFGDGSYALFMTPPPVSPITFPLESPPICT